MITARPALIAATATAALLAGCGGAPAAPHHAARATVTYHAAGFTSQQVADFFSGVTGDELLNDPSDSFDALSPSHADWDRADKLRQRYGTFSVYILHRPDVDVIYKRANGKPVEPDRQGVYWHGSEALKPYASNVVLSWMSDDGKTDERFQRLDAILSKLGHPADKVRASLPAADRPCDGLTAGTCRDASGTTVTTVERDSTLKLPTMQVRATRVETGRVVIGPGDYGMARRAKGRFVLVAMQIANTGDEPIQGLFEAKLKIGDKLYDQDDQATWTVTPQDAFPIQPGDHARAGLVFDLPESAAKQALKVGVLAFPAGDEFATVKDAEKVGQIKLAARPRVGNA